ncbi:MAG: DUF1549 and DUF1553 domain-containing protein [Planctomycetales bacterium]
MAAGAVRAETPLHERIDAAVGFGDAEFEKLAADDADDATFVRRIHLDLVGAVPDADRTRRFLQDDSPNKRAELIDQLLSSPQHARRMQYVFDAMLMERRPHKHIKSDEWRSYLRRSFLENKPWDQLAVEILTADGTDEKTRPAARFLLDREMKIDAVTRDLGRMFLGRDLQCAQCHDHPNIDEYLQRHYHGLAAFLKRSYLFKDPKSKKASIGEKAEGKVEFTSVFTGESGETAPRLLDLPPIEDPPLADDPYQVKPKKNIRSVPVYSRRLQLGVAMTDPANPAFRRNIANRLWAMMMGRGIVEPVDMMHSDNPPSNPKLLDLLADALEDHNYDMRFLLRELALTKTYGRNSEYEGPVDEASEGRFAVAVLKPLSPEQLAWSMMQAVGLTDQTLDRLKAKQLKADAKNGPKQVEDPLWREAALHDALKSCVDAFASSFGVVGIQRRRFDASTNQALFLRNGKLVQSWLEASGKRLTARLKNMEAPEFVDEFYMSIFSRRPTVVEAVYVTQFLDENNDRDAAVRRLVWAALSSAEFRFNH